MMSRIRERESSVARVEAAWAYGLFSVLALSAKVPRRLTSQCSHRLSSGMKVAVVIGAGRGGFYFIIYASCALLASVQPFSALTSPTSADALAFFYGAILIVQGHSTSGEVVTAVFAVVIGAFAL